MLNKDSPDPTTKAEPKEEAVKKVDPTPSTDKQDANLTSKAIDPEKSA